MYQAPANRAGYNTTTLGIPRLATRLTEICGVLKAWGNGEDEKPPGVHEHKMSLSPLGFEAVLPSFYRI